MQPTSHEVCDRKSRCPVLIQVLWMSSTKVDSDSEDDKPLTEPEIPNLRDSAHDSKFWSFIRIASNHPRPRIFLLLIVGQTQFAGGRGSVCMSCSNASTNSSSWDCPIVQHLSRFGRVHSQVPWRRKGQVHFHPNAKKKSSKTFSSKNTFVQKHIHPKTLSSKTISSKTEENFIHDTFIQKRFHPMTHSSKTVSSNDTCVQNRFHPKPLSS